MEAHNPDVMNYFWSVY